LICLVRFILKVTLAWTCSPLAETAGALGIRRRAQLSV
jgi:hypothetical protein